MWSRLSGKSNDKPEASSSRAQDDDTMSMKSTRRKHKSERSDKSVVDDSARDSKKKSSTTKSSSRGDDRDRGLEDSSELYSNGRSRTDASTHKSSKRDKDRTDDDDERKKRGSRGERTRDSSVDTKKSHRRRRSRSAERAPDGRENGERGLIRRSTDPSNARSEREPKERSRAAFDAPSSGGTGFSQFPGQFSSQMPGMPGGFHRVDSDPTSQHSQSHVPQQFPGQFPLETAAPFRPAQAAHEGGVGLAAEYYNDQGESVHHQPGARPGTPIIAGTQPHLQAASHSANPPPEPSSSGGVGAAASFYAGADFGTTPERPSKPGKPGKVSKPGKTSSSGTPSKITKPSKMSSSAAIGAAAASTAAGYYMSGAQPHNQSQSTPPRPQAGKLSASQDISPRMSPDRPSFYHAASGGPQPAYNQGTSSSHANSAMYVAAAAGAAGLAAHEYHQHSQHQQHSTSQYGVSDEYSRPPPGFHYASDHHQHAGYASGGGGIGGGGGGGMNGNGYGDGYSNGYGGGGNMGTGQQHKHKGPIARLVDFFRDPEAVSQFEEYTEYIGVCRYCFDPRSSARDAPRKHYYGRSRKSWEKMNRSGESLHSRKSFEKFNNSQTSINRIDKERRYATGSKKSRRDSEYESDRKTSGFFKGAAAATAAGLVGKKLMERNDDFQDTYSVKTGRPEADYMETRQHRRNSSTDRDRFGRDQSVGITGSPSYKTSDRRESKGEIIGVGRDGRPVRRSSTKDGYSSDKRRRSSNEREAARKNSTLVNAALGTAVGAGVAAVASSSRRRSSSPGHKIAGVQKIQRRRDSISSSGSSKTRRRRKSSSSRPGILSGLFGGGASKKKSASMASKKRKEKQESGFFGLSNASYSSTDSALVFDSDKRDRRTDKKSSKDKRRRKRSESPKIKSDSDARNAVLALGAGMAALSAAKSGHSSDRARKEGLKGKHHIYEPSDANRRHAADPEEGAWEDLPDSDDDSVSVDSALAFGIEDRLRRKRSKDSLSDGSSVSDKWSWRWGGKKTRSRSRSESPILRNREHVHTPTAARFTAAGIAAAAGGVLADKYIKDKRNGSKQDSYFGRNSEIPLREIEPRPISDEAPHISSARPGPVPIQQPQPISPVKKQVYNAQGMPDMPGGFPADDHRGAVAREEGWDKSSRTRRTTSSPPPQLGDLKGKRNSRGPDDSALVRFQFDQEQQRRHDLEEEEELRRSQIEGVEYVPGDSKTKSKRVSRAEKEQRRLQREEKAARKEDAPASRISELQKEIDEIEQNLAKLRAGEKDEADQRQILDQASVDMKRGKDSSVSPMVAAGAAAVAGGLIGKALSDRDKDRSADKKESREDKKTRKRSDSKREQRAEDRPISHDAGRGEVELEQGRKGRDRQDNSRQQTADDRQYEIRQPITSERDSRKSDIDITREELASVGLDRVTRDAMRKVRAGSRSRSPAVQHQSYAEFFAPIGDLSQPAGYKQAAQEPSADNDITVYRADVPDVVTVAPHGPGKIRSNSPAYDYAPDAIFHVDTSRLGTRYGLVPKLELIKPTPMASPSASPRIEPVDKDVQTERTQEQEREREQSPPKNKVSFGDNQTHTYEAHTPEYEPDSFMRDAAVAGTAAAATAIGAAAYNKRKDEGNRSRRESPPQDEQKSSAYPSPGPTEPETPVDEELSRDDIEREEREWQRKHVPGGFGFDDDFTAHVAAGLGASGFDPDIVIKDDQFRKRESPPGSGDEFTSRARSQGKSQSRDTSYERRRPSDVEQLFSFRTDSPGTEGAPPVTGYIEDESVPSTPADELKKHLSRKNTLEGETQMSASSSKASSAVNGKAQETDKSTYKDSFADSAPPEPADDPWDEPAISKKGKKKRDKEKRKSMEATTVSEGILPADQDLKGRPAPARISSAIADTPESSSQSRDIDASNFQAETSQPSTEIPAEDDEDWSGLSKKERKKREKEREKRQSLVDAAAPVNPSPSDADQPGPAVDAWEEATLSKKDKKKRDKEKRRSMTTDLDEAETTGAPEPVLAAEPVDDEWQGIGLSKKEQKKRDKEKRRSMTADFEDAQVESTPEPTPSNPVVDSWDDLNSNKKNRTKQERQRAAEAVLAAGAAGAATTAALVDSPTTYGPEPSAEKQQDDDEWSGLTKKERKKREKEAKRASQMGETIRPEDTIRMVTDDQDQDQAELDIINDAANESEARPELSRSDSKSKKKSRKSTKELFEKAVGHNDDEMDFINEFTDDKPAKPTRGFSDIVEAARSGRAQDIKEEKTRDTPSPSQSRDEFFDAEAEAAEDAPTPTRHRSKSRDRASTPSAAGVPLPSESGASTPTYDRMAQSQELPSRDDGYDSPSGFSVAQTAIGVGEDRERRKKKKKRRSGVYDDDDTKSVVSTPGGRESPKEEKKKGFFAGMFKKSTDDSEKRRKEQAEKEAAETEERERKERKKKHRRSREGASTYGGSDDDSRSVVSRARYDSDDDKKSTRSGSRERRHKHRSSSRHSRVESEHRDRRDLPAKRSDAFDSQSTIRLVPDENDPSKPRDQAEEPQSQSFLGERPDKNKPPDISDEKPLSDVGLAGLGIAAGAALAAATLPAAEKELIGRADTDSPRHRELGDAQEEAELPVTAPTSPAKTPKHRSTLSAVSDSSKNAASSPTAIPLVFRRPPNSRANSTTATPVKSTTSAPTTPGKKDKERRPGSTEFKGKADFRPLYLVERHRRTDAAFDTEEELPALPPSEDTSRANSVHEEDGTSGQPPIDSPSSSKKFLGDPIDLDAARSFEPMDVLDADQPTPTVASVKADRAKREQDLLDAAMQEHMAADLEWQQRQRKGSLLRGVGSSDLEHSLGDGQRQEVYRLGLPVDPLERAESPSSMVATHHADSKPEVRDQFQIPPFKPKEQLHSREASPPREGHGDGIALGLGAAALAGWAALRDPPLSPVVEELKDRNDVQSDEQEARSLPLPEAKVAAPDVSVDDEWVETAAKKGKKGKKTKKGKKASVSEPLEPPATSQGPASDTLVPAVPELLPQSFDKSSPESVEISDPLTVPLPESDDRDLEDHFHNTNEAQIQPGTVKDVFAASQPTSSEPEAAVKNNENEGTVTPIVDTDQAGTESKELDDDLWSHPVPKKSKKDKKKRKSQGSVQDAEEPETADVPLDTLQDSLTTANESEISAEKQLKLNEAGTAKDLGQPSELVTAPDEGPATANTEQALDDEWAVPTAKKSKKDKKKNKRKSQTDDAPTPTAETKAEADEPSFVGATQGSEQQREANLGAPQSSDYPEGSLGLESQPEDSKDVRDLGHESIPLISEESSTSISQGLEDEWAPTTSKSKKDKKKNKRKTQVDEAELLATAAAAATAVVAAEASCLPSQSTEETDKSITRADNNVQAESGATEASLSADRAANEQTQDPQGLDEHVESAVDVSTEASEQVEALKDQEIDTNTEADVTRGQTVAITQDPDDEWAPASSGKKSKKDKEKNKRKSQLEQLVTDHSIVDAAHEPASELVKGTPTVEESIPDQIARTKNDTELGVDTAAGALESPIATRTAEPEEEWADTSSGKKAKKEKRKNKRKSQIEEELTPPTDSQTKTEVALIPASDDVVELNRELLESEDVRTAPAVKNPVVSEEAPALVNTDDTVVETAIAPAESQTEEWAVSSGKMSKKDKKKRKSQAEQEATATTAIESLERNTSPAASESAEASKEVLAEPTPSDGMINTEQAQTSETSSELTKSNTNDDTLEDEWATSTSKKSKKDKKKSKRRSQLGDEAELAHDSEVNPAAETSSPAITAEVREAEKVSLPVEPEAVEQAVQAAEADLTTLEHAGESNAAGPANQNVNEPEDDFFSAVSSSKSRKGKKNKRESLGSVSEKPAIVVPEEAVVSTPTDENPPANQSDYFPVDASNMIDTPGIEPSTDTILQDLATPADMPPELTGKSTEELIREINAGASPSAVEAPEKQPESGVQEAVPDEMVAAIDAAAEVDIDEVPRDDSVPESTPAEDEWAVSSASQKSKKNKKGKKKREVSPSSLESSPRTAKPTGPESVAQTAVEAPLPDTSEAANVEAAPSKEGKKDRKGKKSPDQSPPGTEQQTSLTEDVAMDADETPFTDAQEKPPENEGDSALAEETPETVNVNQDSESPSGSKKSKKKGKKNKRASVPEDNGTEDEYSASVQTPIDDNTITTEQNRDDKVENEALAGKAALGAGLGLGLGLALSTEDSDLSEIMAKNEEAVTPLPEDDFAPLTRKLSKKNKRVSWPAERDLVVEHEISAPPSGIATPAELNISIPSALKDIPPGTTSDQIPSPSWDTSPTDTRNDEESWGFGRRERRGSQSESDSGSPEIAGAGTLGDDNSEWSSGFGKHKKGKKNRKGKTNATTAADPTDNLSAIQEENLEGENASKVVTVMSEEPLPTSVVTEHASDSATPQNNTEEVEKNHAADVEEPTETIPASDNKDLPENGAKNMSPDGKLSELGKADIEAEEWGTSTSRKSKKGKKGKKAKYLDDAEPDPEAPPSSEDIPDTTTTGGGKLSEDSSKFVSPSGLSLPAESTPAEPEAQDESDLGLSNTNKSDEETREPSADDKNAEPTQTLSTPEVEEEEIKDPIEVLPLPDDTLIAPSAVAAKTISEPSSAADPAVDDEWETGKSKKGKKGKKSKKVGSQDDASQSGSAPVARIQQESAAASRDAQDLEAPAESVWEETSARDPVQADDEWATPTPKKGKKGKKGKRASSSFPETTNASEVNANSNDLDARTEHTGTSAVDKAMDDPMLEPVMPGSFQDNDEMTQAQPADTKVPALDNITPEVTDGAQRQDLAGYDNGIGQPTVADQLPGPELLYQEPIEEKPDFYPEIPSEDQAINMQTEQPEAVASQPEAEDEWAFTASNKKNCKKGKKSKRSSTVEADKAALENSITSAADDQSIPRDQAPAAEPLITDQNQISAEPLDSVGEHAVDEPIEPSRPTEDDEWAVPQRKSSKKDKKKKKQDFIENNPTIERSSVPAAAAVGAIVAEATTATLASADTQDGSQETPAVPSTESSSKHAEDVNADDRLDPVAAEDESGGTASKRNKKDKKDKKKKRQSVAQDELFTEAKTSQDELLPIPVGREDIPESLPNEHTENIQDGNYDYDMLDDQGLADTAANEGSASAKGSAPAEEEWTAQSSGKKKKDKKKKRQSVGLEEPAASTDITMLEEPGVKAPLNDAPITPGYMLVSEDSANKDAEMLDVSEAVSESRAEKEPHAKPDEDEWSAATPSRKGSKKDKKKKGRKSQTVDWDEPEQRTEEDIMPTANETVQDHEVIDEAKDAMDISIDPLSTLEGPASLGTSVPLMMDEPATIVAQASEPMAESEPGPVQRKPSKKDNKKGKKAQELPWEDDTKTSREPVADEATQSGFLEDAAARVGNLRHVLDSQATETMLPETARDAEGAHMPITPVEDNDDDVFAEVTSTKKGKKGKKGRKDKTSAFSWDEEVPEAATNEPRESKSLEAPKEDLVLSEHPQTAENTDVQTAMDYEESLPQWSFGADDAKREVALEGNAETSPPQNKPSKAKAGIASKLAMFEAAAPVAAEGLHRSKTVRRKNGRHHDEETPATPVSHESQSREESYDLNAPTPGRQQTQSPELPSLAGHGYITPARDVDREPSPIDSTSKDRSSAALFSSSPSIRDTPTHARHRAHRSIEEISRGEDLRSMRSPPATPAFDGRGGTPLMTVTEQSPEEHAAQRFRREQGDIARSDSALRPAKRRSAYGLAEHRASARSPLPEHDKARRLGHISGDDLHAKHEADAVPSHEGVRKSSGRHERPRSIITSGDIDPNYRTFSGASVRSGESISAYIRDDRPTSASPSLRHEKRSVSSDLRKAGQTSEREREREDSGETRETSDTKHAQLGGNELAALGLAGAGLAATAAAFAGPSTYDPAIDKGKARITRMNDVYEAWGEQPGSPRSPSRPPSVRRRQSLQILDLEGRLDSLVSENRLLQDGKARAERQLESTSQQHSSSLQTHQETIRSRDLHLAEKDQELEALRNVLNSLQGEVARLTQSNRELTETKSGEADVAEQYRELQAEHEQTRQLHEQSTRELTDMRDKHSSMSRGMEGIVAAEVSSAVAAAVASKDAELHRLQSELEAAQNKIRALQQEILASRNASANDDVLVSRDADYFDTKCQQLCQHVQQWVLRFSKFSDSKKCRSVADIRNEKITDRYENAILDGTEVDELLQDRVRRRDVFMSVVVTMIFEFVFTRYLFGMDREQRQKLKTLEKTLTEVGPPAAVNKWRATTLTLLSHRNQFRAQREQDTEAVVQEIFDTLATILPPPGPLANQITASLTKVLSLAVDLSIEMRTQRAEYVMLPPLQPEYDTNGDLAHTVPFRDDLMNERSGKFADNDDVPEGSVVRIVLFPLVVKRGDEDGQGDEQEVVCPAQVLIASDDEKRGKRAISEMPDAMKSVRSIAPSTWGAPSEGGMF